MFHYNDYYVYLACGKTDMRININGLFDIVQHQFRPDVAMDENTMDITLEDFENIIKAPTKETNKRKINLNLVRM